MNAIGHRARPFVGPTISLNSGDYFDFLAPEASPIRIEDIAHALAMTCRFGGHCEQFYSVAEHSVHVSRHVPFGMELTALLHDAAEAYCGDVVKPLKDLLPEYKILEERVEAAVFARFNCFFPLPPQVKEIDVRMLATEYRQLMVNRDEWESTRGRAALPVKIQAWGPAEAKRRFLARYHEIVGI